MRGAMLHCGDGVIACMACAYLHRVRDYEEQGISVRSECACLHCMAAMVCCLVCVCFR
jgi:hypothetical protein